LSLNPTTKRRDQVGIEEALLYYDQHGIHDTTVKHFMNHECMHVHQLGHSKTDY